MISLDEGGVELTWLKIGHSNEYKMIRFVKGGFVGLIRSLWVQLIWTIDNMYFTEMISLTSESQTVRFSVNTQKF